MWGFQRDVSGKRATATLHLSIKVPSRVRMDPRLELGFLPGYLKEHRERAAGPEKEPFRGVLLHLRDQVMTV